MCAVLLDHSTKRWQYFAPRLLAPLNPTSGNRRRKRPNRALPRVCIEGQSIGLFDELADCSSASSFDKVGINEYPRSVFRLMCSKPRQALQENSAPVVRQIAADIPECVD